MTMRNTPTRRLIIRLLVAISVAAGFAAPASAQLSITAPTSGNDLDLASARDYATEVLANPWDMDSERDLGDYFTQEIGPPITNRDYTNGVFSYDITSGDSAFFHMLSPGICSSNHFGKNGLRLPIDSTLYRYLSIHMYSETSDNMYILWYSTCGGPSAKYRRTNPIVISPGWHTYVIDLETVGYSSNGNGETRSWSQVQQVTGLRIDPGGVNASVGNPLHRKIDWMTLTATPPASTSNITYTVAPQGGATRYSLAIDNDGNPFNGVTKWLVQDGNASAGSVSLPISSSGLFYGGYSVSGFLSNDWTSLNFGDPWDFASSSDVAHLDGLSGTVANGSLSGTTAATPNFIRLSMHESTFDGDDYNQVCLNMSTSAGGMACLYSDGGNHCYNISAGQHTYAIDMSTIWQNKTISYLILSPADASGVTYQLNWVSLNRSGCTNTDSSPTIVTSSGNLVVNQPPTFEILQPDAKGGADFSQAILGNPWNMNDKDDVKFFSNVTSASMLTNNSKYGRQGDFLCVTSKTGSDDPYHPFLDERAGSDLAIPARFKNATITFWVDRDQTEDSGSTLRIIPCNFLRDGAGACLSGDDTFYQGKRWVTLTQDMTKLQLEEVLHPNPPSPLWAGYFNGFRIDILEALEPTTYCIDRVELREDDLANNQFNVTYALDDSDSLPGSVSVSFFYSTTEGATSGGTAIPNAQNLPLSRASRSFVFDTSALANATYYVYGIATDGLNNMAVAATGRLVVDHSITADSMAPAVQVNHPDEGRVVYTGSGMVVDGIAIDETQLADVDVLLDGTLLSSFVPSDFDKSARDQFPSYADSSNAGFFKTISLASVSVGSHVVVVRGCDTTGNCSQVSRNITVAAGSDPAPVTPAASPEDPALNLISTPPSLQVSLDKKGNFTLLANDTVSCSSTISFTASLTKTDITRGKGTVLYSANVSGRTSIQVKAKKKIFRIKATGKKALVYFGVACGADKPKSAKQVSFGNIKSAKQTVREKYLKYLKPLLKEP